MFENVSILALIGGVVVSMIIGYVWYGPLFGKLWASLQGWSEEDMKTKQSQGMAKSYAIMALGSLVATYIIGVFAKTTGSVTLVDGVSLGFFVWLGFAVPLQLSSILWEGKPVKLYALNVGYNLVTYVIIGSIVALWA